MKYRCTIFDNAPKVYLLFYYRHFFLADSDLTGLNSAFHQRTPILIK